MEENTGFMDKLSELITNFDMANFMPELGSVIGWVELIARIAVLAGPLLVLIFGIVYFFFPPSEANHSLGYRFYWGMGSVEAWQFTQRVAGVSWMAVGFVLTVIMAVICNSYRGMDTPAMVGSAVSCLLWQIGVIGVVCLLVDLVVALRFDRKGNVRENTVIRVSEDFLVLKKPDIKLPKWKLPELKKLLPKKKEAPAQQPEEQTQQPEETEE